MNCGSERKKLKKLILFVLLKLLKWTENDKLAFILLLNQIWGKDASCFKRV